MELLDVYTLFDVAPVKGKGCWVMDEHGSKYLDCYGGHAVISIGHGHPHYVNRIKAQLDALAFYSNSVVNPLQDELASLLGELSGCDAYRLFLCNSGAEANENALKMASFVTGREAVLAVKNSFHGRTSAAVAATDNPSICAPINAQHKVTFVPMNDQDALVQELETGTYCAFILECIQGVGGLDMPTADFIKAAAEACRKSGTLFIADEVQSGFARTGKFFAFQHYGVEPDLISMAKGMGNGFPVGGILVHPRLESWKGMLGTTFGGNHLACAATLAVLEVIEAESLMEHAEKMGAYIRSQVQDLPGLQKVKGRGLMLGLEFDEEVGALRKDLVKQHHIFTGGAANKKLLRILPPLTIEKEEIDALLEGLKKSLGSTLKTKTTES